MITICESCGADILTEADPHVVRPTPQGYKFYCYCHIKGFEEVETRINQLEAMIQGLIEAQRPLLAEWHRLKSQGGNNVG